MKNKLFILLSLICLWLVLELLSFIGLAAFGRFKGITFEPLPVYGVSQPHRRILNALLSDSMQYLDYSTSLGWTIKPNGQKGLYRANAQGVRAERDTPPRPEEGRIRIATFGDSFTHCDDVSFNQSWQALMQEENPQLEVLNFGVPGYGLDQAFLRYKYEGASFSPHIVMLGYMINNVERIVNTFRPFYSPKTSLPLSKPRFVLDNGGLTLLANPMQTREDYRSLLNNDQAVLERLKKNDFYYNKKYYEGPFDFLPSVRFFKVASRAVKVAGNKRDIDTAFQIAEKIFLEFHSLALENGARPVVLLIPAKEDMYRKAKGRPMRYQNILEMMKKHKLEYVDLQHAFDINSKEFDLDRLYTLKHHFSPRANRAAARHILIVLKHKGYI